MSDKYRCINITNVGNLEVLTDALNDGWRIINNFSCYDMIIVVLLKNKTK